MSISNISLAVPDSGYYCPLCDFPIDDSEHTVELELFRFKLSRLEQFGVEMIVHHEEMARKFGRDNMLIVNGIPRHWTVSAVKKYFGVACSASGDDCDCTKYVRLAEKYRAPSSVNAVYIIIFTEAKRVMNCLRANKDKEQLLTSDTRKIQVASCALCEVYDMIHDFSWAKYSASEKYITVSMFEDLHYIMIMKFAAVHETMTTIMKQYDIVDKSTESFLLDLYACVDVRHGQRPSVHKRASLLRQDGTDYKLSRKDFRDLFQCIHLGIGGPGAPTTKYISVNGVEKLHTFRPAERDRAVWKVGSVQAKRLRNAVIFASPPHELLKKMRQKVYPFRILCQQIVFMGHKEVLDAVLTEYDFAEALSIMPSTSQFVNFYDSMWKVYTTYREIEPKLIKNGLSSELLVGFFAGLCRGKYYLECINNFDYVSYPIQDDIQHAAAKKKMPFEAYMGIQFQYFVNSIRNSYEHIGNERSNLLYYIKNVLYRFLLLKNIIEISTAVRSIYQDRGLLRRKGLCILTSVIEGYVSVFAIMLFIDYFISWNDINLITGCFGGGEGWFFPFPVMEGRGWIMFMISLIFAIIRSHQDLLDERALVSTDIPHHRKYRELKYGTVNIHMFGTGVTKTFNAKHFLDTYVLDKSVEMQKMDDPASSSIRQLSFLYSGNGAASRGILKSMRVAMAILVVMTLITALEYFVAAKDPKVRHGTNLIHSVFTNFMVFSFSFSLFASLLLFSGLGISMFISAKGIWIALVRFNALTDPLKATKKTKLGRGDGNDHVTLPGYVVLNDAATVKIWLSMRRFMIANMQQRMVQLNFRAILLIFFMFLCCAIRYFYYSAVSLYFPYPLILSYETTRRLRISYEAEVKGESEMFTWFTILVAMPIFAFVKCVADINELLDSHDTLIASAYAKAQASLFMSKKRLQQNSQPHGGVSTKAHVEEFQAAQAENNDKTLTLSMLKRALEVFSSRMDHISVGFVEITHAFLVLTIFPVLATAVVPILLRVYKNVDPVVAEDFKLNNSTGALEAEGLCPRPWQHI